MSYVINIADHFSALPGGRLRASGPGSAEEFYADHLRPQFILALKDGVGLIVDLDGTAGFAASWLEEAFGGLAREFGSDVVCLRLMVRCSDEPYLLREIQDYINLR